MMRQVRAGVEDLGSSGGHFGALVGRPNGVRHIGLGATYQIFDQGDNLPQLHIDADFVALTHTVSYASVQWIDSLNTILPVFSSSGEGVNSIRLAPSFRMARMSIDGVSFYRQFGPAFHWIFPPNRDGGRYAYNFWYQERRNVIALAGEVGFGYRGFFLYGSYDYGLTPYGYGRHLSGDAKQDMVQKYRVARVGISYHPRLTQRLKRTEEAMRRSRAR